MRERRIVVFGVLAGGVVLDQLTKMIAKAYLPRDEAWTYLGDTLRLQLAHNYGAFLSLGDSLSAGWRQGLLTGGVACILIGLFAWLMWSKKIDARSVLPLSLVLAGGVSNLIDRIVYGGYVVDFLNMGLGSLRTGVFNVADIAISTGVVWLLVSEFAGKRAGAAA